MDQTAKTNQDLLLVIDMQNVYTKGQEWACEEVEKASDSIPGRREITMFL